MTIPDRCKYRAYHIPTDEIYDVYGFNECFVFIDTLDTCEPLKADDCILLQCTGYKTKEGKLIYEGDLIKQENRIYQVIFTYEDVASCGCCIQSFSGCGFVLQAKDEVRGELIGIDASDIIGNIHENPELLEVQDEI